MPIDPLAAAEDTLPIEVTRLIDRLCDEYEEALVVGSPPPGFSEYANAITGEGRKKLLNELIALALAHLDSEGVKDARRALLNANSDLGLEIAPIVERSMVTAAYCGLLKGAGASPTPRRSRSRTLRIRCPHCGNAVELIGDTALDSVDCPSCGSAFSLVDRATETRMAHALQRFGRYELVSRIGVGGFGTVWKARDTELDRVVAVKIPRHGQLSDEEVTQFFREAKAAAQLRHPNIVSIHDVGQEGDAVYIVSDLIRGVSLRDLLTGGLPPRHQAAELIATAAAALEHAHRRGVVHRDLKPSNIMIDEWGEPHLMDFGLAKRDSDEITMTTDGQIVGTPAYMAPEQAEGLSASVDRRADIYSLGVMLFEMLTGELPFRGNAEMQAYKRTTEDAPNAKTLNPTTPLDLATICSKCLERAPGNRYASAQEVAQELRRYLSGESIKARPLSFVQRATRWVQRHPWPTAVGGLVAALAVGGPMAAAVIESQRSQLAVRFNERNDLIEQANVDKTAAARTIVDLQAKLDAWEGRADPWGIWPPYNQAPPRQAQLASFYAAREADLTAAAVIPSASPLDRARLRISLAILAEAATNPRRAMSELELAIEALEEIPHESSGGFEVAMTKADCCERLSTLTAPSDREASIAWLTRAREIRDRVSESRPSDPAVAASTLATEMRRYAAIGFDAAQPALGDLYDASAALDELWPTQAEEVYRLACELSGQPLRLAGTEASAGD